MFTRTPLVEFGLGVPDGRPTPVDPARKRGRASMIIPPRRDQGLLELQIQKGRRRLAWFMAFLAGMTVFFILSGANAVLFDRARLQQSVESFGVLRGAFFLLGLFVACEALVFVPGIPYLLAWVSVFVFGLWRGWLITTLGTVTANVISFATTRSFGAHVGLLDDVEPSSRTGRFLAFLHRRPILAITVVRNVPFGQWPLINVALALTEVTFAQYTLGTIIGNPINSLQHSLVAEFTLSAILPAVFSSHLEHLGSTCNSSSILCGNLTDVR